MFKMRKKYTILLLFVAFLTVFLIKTPILTASAEAQKDVQTLLDENVLGQLSKLDLEQLQAYINSLVQHSASSQTLA